MKLTKLKKWLESLSSRRVEKVQKELRSIVASYLLNMTGYFSGMVSVTYVIASGDLRNAKVFVTVMQENEDQKLLERDIEIMQEEAKLIQKEVAHQLPMKFCPKLTFILDPSIDKILKIDGILHELSQKNTNQ